jgi:hypothetical protein
MATSDQQVFIKVVSVYLSAMPTSAGRCDSHAALSFAGIARNPWRHQLASWAWKTMRNCDNELMRVVHQQQDHVDALLADIGTTIRSNTALRGGSVLSRVQRVVRSYNVMWDALQFVYGEHPMLRSRVDAEMPRIMLAGRARENMLATQPHEGEDVFTESEEEDGEDESEEVSDEGDAP